MGCDLAPRPTHLPTSIQWRQGDLFAAEDTLEGGTLVASLFLHHFHPPELERIGRMAERFDRLLFVEPHRDRLGLGLAHLLLPFVGRVTRHDMPVSIRAGFVPGELTERLRLGTAWEVEEKTTLRGALRYHATRRG